MAQGGDGRQLGLARRDRLQRLAATQLIDCLRAMNATDSVVFCHFIAINVLVGAARGDDQMVQFRPDNASITVVDNAGGRIEIVELGRDAETFVN